MKEQIAKDWVKDLRESGAQQTCGALYDGRGYCCLGRLCVILGYTFTRSDEDGKYRISGTQESNILTEQIQKQAGMHSLDGDLNRVELDLTAISLKFGTISLADLNDNGWTFAKIADLIEKHWQDL